MLNLCEYIIRQSDLHERAAPKKVMEFNDLPQSFLCDNHLENIKFFKVKNTKFLKFFKVKNTSRRFLKLKKTAQVVLSFLIIPKNLPIAKCEEKLYNNSKRGKGSDDTHDRNKTLQLQYCLRKRHNTQYSFF